MGSRSRRTRLVLVGFVLAIVLASAFSAWRFNPSSGVPLLAVPSRAGLNYAFPHTLTGAWLGTEWLRSSTDRGTWNETAPALNADLDFVRRQNLGKVMRVFIGLDQLMVWDANAGFDGFDQAALDHLSSAFDVFDAHGMKVIAVLYDQEEVASAGNFHFEALDGNHDIMRRNYLRATSEFLRRFGARDTVIGWDLFNEAYGSLAPDGGLPRPPHADPVSPNYSDATVHAWLRDLYRTAKAAAPSARFTVSDSTELYWNSDPDLSKYSDVVDFYDIHVYDDNPKYPNWRWMLDKPYVVGEAGASTHDQHYEDQSINTGAVSYLLQHAGSAGVSLVLVQGPAFSSQRDGLNPTGAALASYLRTSPGAGGGTAQRPNPVDVVVGALVAVARRVHKLATG